MDVPSVIIDPNPSSEGSSFGNSRNEATSPQIIPRNSIPIPSESPVLNTPSNTKIKNSPWLLISFTVLMACLSIGTTYWLIANMNGFKDSKPASNSVTAEDVQLGDIQAQFPSTHHSFIAYTRGDFEEKMNVYIYDIDSKQTTRYLDIININSTRAIIGDWSPTGRYLPVISYISPKQGGLPDTFSIYIFDAETKTTTKIFESPKTTSKSDIAIWITAFDLTSPWLDDNKLILHNDYFIVPNTQSITYITLQGELKNETRPKDYLSKFSNNELQVFYQLGSSHGASISSILYKNTPLSYKPDGEVIGIIRGSLAVLKRPPSFDITNKRDMAIVDAEAEKLKKQGLSDMEISLKLLEFIEPNGETLVRLYNLNTGEIALSFDISEHSWYTDGIFVSSNTYNLIAHQTDKRMLPTKERYIQINTESFPQIRVISENISTRNTVSDQYQLVHGAPFSLAADGTWIVAFRGISPTQEGPFGDTMLYLINIQTGNELIFCESNCQIFSAYNPFSLQ